MIRMKVYFTLCDFYSRFTFSMTNLRSHYQTDRIMSLKRHILKPLLRCLLVRISLVVGVFVLAVKCHGRPLRVFSPAYFAPASRMQTSMHASKQQQEVALQQQRPKIPGLAKVLSYFGGNVPAKTKPAATETKVVTDIDDTIVSSGGVKLFGIALGGIDNLYRRGQFYPGAVQFLFELSRPPGSPSYSKISYSNGTDSVVSFRFSSSSSPFVQLPARVAVLTARAREFKFALALKASHKVAKAFANIGSVNGMPGWGIGDVYYGSVAEWIFQKRKGLRKFANFELMLQSDDKQGSKHVSDNQRSDKKKRQYVMVGDTGEKDEEAAERIAISYPDRLRAVFLHQVYTVPTISSSPPLVTRPDRKVNGVPFYYFRTYVGAAAKAQRAGIINNEAVQRVTDQALADLRDLDDLPLPFDGKRVKVIKKNESLLGMLYKEVNEARALRWQEITRDIKAISSLKVKI